MAITDIIKSLDKATFGNLLMPDVSRRVKILRKMLNYSNGLFIDLGCDNANFQRKLRLPNIKFIGVDTNLNALEDAIKMGHNVVLASAAVLPFKNGCFDGCICTEVLEHVERDKEAISEIARVVRKNGEIFISVPYAKAEEVVNRKELTEEMYSCLEAHVRKGYTINELNEKFRVYNMKLMSHRYDLKFVGAWLALFWFMFMTREKEAKTKLWTVLRRVYVRILIIMGPIYNIDNLTNRKGFTLFAEFLKE